MVDDDSIVAVGGWCAPSHALYDLGIDETRSKMLREIELQALDALCRWIQSWPTTYSVPEVK